MVVCGHDPVTRALIRKLQAHGIPFVIALEQSGQEEPALLPEPDAVLRQDMTLILIGSLEQEARCRETLH